MKFIIHHLGKAGEAFSALPLAKTLKESYPDCHITWVILDLYRDALGESPFIDDIEIIPTYSCKNLDDVGNYIRFHRKIFFNNKKIVKNNYGIHIDAYYDYIIKKVGHLRFELNRDPFYLQFFNTISELSKSFDVVKSWAPPEWIPTKQALADADKFKKLYGGGKVIIFSPFVSDKMCLADNETQYDQKIILFELKKFGLPILVTGTKWDEKIISDGIIDAYSPNLSLGGLFQIIKEDAALVVSPNSGIGFAAHWLGAPCIMIDNRVGWKEQVKLWKEKLTILYDDALENESRWPAFVKENFPTGHMKNIPFFQFEWSQEMYNSSLNNIINWLKNIKSQINTRQDFVDLDNEKIIKEEKKLIARHPLKGDIYLPTEKYSRQDRIVGINKVVDLYENKFDNYYVPKLKDTLKQFKGLHRCFVIGNGPSINETDLSKLKNEVSFGVNGIFLKSEEIGFKPTFYVVEDHLVAEDRAEFIHRFNGVTKLFPFYLAYCLNEGPDTIFFNHRPRKSYPHGFDFSTDASNVTYTGCTVTFTCLQLAFSLGVKEIYLIGVDHSYAIPESTKVEKSYNVEIYDMPEDDPNHFDPNYFGKGFRWHNPQSDKMEEAYREAKRVTDLHGVTIYNATKGGKLEVFPRVDYDSLF